MDKKWEDLLGENDGNVFLAAQEHYIETGQIHPDIPIDNIEELVDATPSNSSFGQALRAQLALS